MRFHRIGGGAAICRAAVVVVLAVFMVAPAVAQQKPTVPEALKQAGLGALPEFLNAATESITIRFPAALGGGSLTFGGTVDANALTEKRFVFTTSDQHRLSWNKAFGMGWVHLSDVALSLEMAKGVFDIKLHGKASGILGRGSAPREVIVELDVRDRKLHDFTLALPDTTLELSRLPGFGGVPGAAGFKLSNPVVSKDALGGKVAFHREIVDAVVFEDREKQSWAVGIRLEKPLSVADLVNHRTGLLTKIMLPRMTVLVSSKQVDKAYEALPLAARAFFSTGGSLPEGNLEAVDGVTVLSTFDPAALPSDVRSALAKIGLKQKLEIVGEVGGMFGGADPWVKLAADIPMPSDHGFPFLKASAAAKHQFFIKLSKQEQAVGFSTTVELPGGKGKAPLLFDVAFELDAQESGVEVLVAGDMRGDWHDAVGIKGLTLENPFLSVGINETAGFDVMIDGTVMVGQEKVRAAADIVLQPAEAFLPESLALAGTVNKISFNALNAHARKHATLKGGGLKDVNAELRDVAFAFMTPGAKLPTDLEQKLHLEGAGIALAGQLYVNHKELGEAKAYASTEGLYANGKLSPFKLGPLDLKAAELLVQAGPSVDPRFMMKGDLALFRGYDEAYALDLAPTHFEFSSDTKFGGAFEAVLKAESAGLNFEPGNDFAFEAELAAKYDKIFRNLVTDALKELQKADKSMAKAENDVKAAERKVADLNKQIADAKAEAQRAYNGATSKIRDAESKVDSLNGHIRSLRKDIQNLQSDIKDDKKHWRFDRAAKHGVELGEKETELGSTEAALKTANWALETARKTVHAVPVDAAPKVVELQGRLATEEAGLRTAQGVLAAAREANKGVEAAGKALLQASAQFKINRLGASGSLLGITSGGKSGKKPTLIIDCTIRNDRHVFRESLDSLDHEFSALAKQLAKDVAHALVEAFKKA